MRFPEKHRDIIRKTGGEYSRINELELLYMIHITGALSLPFICVGGRRINGAKKNESTVIAQVRNDMVFHENKQNPPTLDAMSRAL